MGTFEPVEHLRKVRQDLTFLRDIPDDQLEPLLRQLTEVRFEDGAVILTAGQYTDSAFIIAEGQVEMRAAGRAPLAAQPRVGRTPRRWFGGSRAKEPVKAERPFIGHADRTGETDAPVVLEAGDIFGETSALSRYPVPATVTANGPGRFWKIGPSALRQFLDLPELAGFQAFFDDRYRQRALASVLRRVGPFRGLTERTLARVRDRAQLVSVKPGKTIAAEGTPVDGLYIVRGGWIKVVAGAVDKALVATYLRPGDFAGEFALFLDEPWPFSLVAVENVELVRIAREDADAMIRESPDLGGELGRHAAEQLKARGRTRAHPTPDSALQRAMDSELIHGESVLLIDLTTCTRCDDCVRACAETHAGMPRFVREGARLGRFSVPSACYHCTDPVCMIGCPTGAISRPFGTREVVVNENTCIGCGNCATRCPWDNIHSAKFDSPLYGQIDLAVKCDLCAGREAGPACVQMCPHGAAVRINFKDLEEVERTLREDQ